jgi:hypothetical protein
LNIGINVWNPLFVFLQFNSLFLEELPHLVVVFFELVTIKSSFS